MKNRLRLIIFDLDGTLVDTEPIYRIGWIKALGKNGFSADKAEIANWNGKSLVETTTIIKDKIQNESMSNKILSDREAFILDQLEKGLIKAKPFARELLLFLKKEGIEIALATSTRKERGLRILAKFGLTSYFDCLVFGDEVTAAKPHPDSYNKVLALTKRQPDESLVIEDSQIGCLAAQKAGLPVFLITDTPFPHEDLKSIFRCSSSLRAVREWFLTTR